MPHALEPLNEKLVLTRVRTHRGDERRVKDGVYGECDRACVDGWFWVRIWKANDDVGFDLKSVCSSPLLDLDLDLLKPMMMVRVVDGDEARRTFGGRSGIPPPQGGDNTMEVMRQRGDWDCGLACATTLARFVLGERNAPSLDDVRRAIGRRKSVWTIDLAFALKKCGVERVVMCTTCAGTNAGLCEEAFYRDDLLDDARRVNGLFSRCKRALKDGGSGDETVPELRVQSLTREALVEVIKAGWFAMALVDKYTMLSNTQEQDDDDDDATGFIGHYVVIVGVHDSIAGRLFTVLDPSGEESFKLSVPSDRLDKARKTLGTDEDLIFVSPQR